MALLSDDEPILKQAEIDALSGMVVIESEDLINHPPHYKEGGIETIDFIEAKKFNYNIGNAVKYLSRYKHKDSPIDDLKKARWYIDREIGVVEGSNNGEK